MPATRLNARLRRLEKVVGVARCPACRDRRGLVVIRTFHPSAGGPVLAHGEGPQPCSLCGEVPEEVVKIVRAVVTARDEAVQWHAGASAPQREAAATTP